MSFGQKYPDFAELFEDKTGLRTGAYADFVVSKLRKIVTKVFK